MALVFYKSLSYPNFPLVTVLPTTASVTYVDGDALVLTAGALTKAGPTVKPDFICSQDYVAPATGMLPISCYPVLPGDQFLAPFSVDGTAIKNGDTVTLHTDSAGVTATTTSGVARIINKLGTGAIGTMAVVTFK